MINQAVDLFSRIRTTEQAEEVVTVLYACRQLKKAHPTDTISEQDIYDYVLSWKKTWNRDEKRRAVASTIRNLVALGWMRTQVSENLLEVAWRRLTPLDVSAETHQNGAKSLT